MALCRLYVSVGYANHMKHDIIIMHVLMVTVQIPVASLVVDLHISHPQCSADLHLGIEEIRTAVAVVQSGIYDFHRPAVSGFKPLQRPHLMLPTVVQ